MKVLSIKIAKFQSFIFILNTLIKYAYRHQQTLRPLRIL